MIDRAAGRGSRRAGPARILACGLLSWLSVSCASKALVVENSEEILATKEYENVIDVQTLPDEQAKSAEVPGEYVRSDAPPYAPPPSIQSQLPGGANAKSGVPSASKKRGKKSQADATVSGPSAVSPANPSSKGPNSKGPSKTAGSATKKSETKSTEPSDATSQSTVAVAPTTVAATSGPRQPPLEDAEGFSGRRPINDPWRVGESVTLELSYFNVVAGDMTLMVKPFKMVNGRKAYHFAGQTVSTSVFSVFYSVDDRMETFVDYEDLIPFNYSLHVKESKQLREVRSYFDWKAMKGFVWDKKVTNDKGAQEKKYEWDILSYTQNVFSAPFYLRAFKLEPGKKIQFRVGHEGKNLLLTAEVLRRETIETALGEMKTVVIKPTIEIDGVFKPVGDILFWLTDDDRRYIVRLESKIKIGKVLGQIKKIVPGE